MQQLAQTAQKETTSHVPSEFTQNTTFVSSSPLSLHLIAKFVGTTLKRNKKCSFLNLCQNCCINTFCTATLKVVAFLAFVLS